MRSCTNGSERLKRTSINHILTLVWSTPRFSWFHFASILEPDMPVNLSIKNAPEKVVRKLRKRAERNHRSLQGELIAIITEAAERPKSIAVRELMARGLLRGLTSQAVAHA